MYSGKFFEIENQVAPIQLFKGDEVVLTVDFDEDIPILESLEDSGISPSLETRDEANLGPKALVLHEV